MKNVIQLENYRRQERDCRLLQRGSSENQLVEAKYLYDDDGEGIFGTNRLIGGFEFISIKMVEAHIEEEREAIRTGYDKYGNETDLEEFEPWEEDGVIVCEEGVFIWDWETECYEWIGELEQTIRKKVVQVQEESVVKMGNDFLTLECGSKYLVDGEYVAYDENMNPVVMLAINPIGCVPLAVPFDGEVLLVIELDFAVIDYCE